MGREGRLVKNFLIYMVGNFASKVLGFVLLPIYTIYLSQSELGFYDLVITTIQIVISVVTLQSIDGLYRNLLDAKDETVVRQNITNAFFIISRNVLLFILAFSGVFICKPIPHAWLILLLSVSHIYWTFWQQTARGLKRNMDFALGGLIFTVIMLAGNLILLKIFRLQVAGVLISSIASAIITILYLEIRIQLFQRIQLKKLDARLQKSIITYSLPLLPTAINWWLLSFANRYVINITMGTDANGLFAVASRFAAILVMVNNIFYLAWQESAITEYSADDRNRFYSQMFDAYMRIQFSVILLLLPVTPFIFNLIIDSKFSEAWQYIPFLYIGTVFSAFATFYGTGYLSSRETKGAFTTTLIGSVVNLILMFILIPIWGLQAVGFSSMVSLILLWGIRIVQTRKYFHIRIKLNAFLGFVLCVALYTVAYFLNRALVYAGLFVLATGLTLFANRRFIRKLSHRFRQKLVSNEESSE